MKMNTEIFLLLALAGIAVAFQTGVNGALGRQIGTIEASFTSFAVGTIFIFIAMMVFGKGNIFLIKNVPWWQLTGGILGAVYVMTSVLMVPRIGIGGVLMLLIIAQLSTSAVIDHFGIFTGTPIPINWKKILALGMMFSALWLFYKK
ncbi:DMT family transporter [Cytophaga aurantiaca]|uniref:DMT family transporter n=1 Tax=Cytophaga aurantiaca TaxID=29530 RepID=UPI000367DFB5|nr:DMT family transporter [Cytophaga aurantiaca]